MNSELVGVLNNPVLPSLKTWGLELEIGKSDDPNRSERSGYYNRSVLRLAQSGCDALHELVRVEGRVSLRVTTRKSKIRRLLLRSVWTSFSVSEWCILKALFDLGDFK